MATKLDKSVIRESTVIADERKIIITLGDDQTVGMKLKGMKSGAVSIPIDNLYKALTGDGNLKDSGSSDKGSVTIEHSSVSNVKGTEPIINLNDFRSQYLINTDIPLDVKVRLESITVKLIESFKKTRR
jgi:hypothetical protein